MLKLYNIENKEYLDKTIMRFVELDYLVSEKHRENLEFPCLISATVSYCSRLIEITYFKKDIIFNAFR